MLEKFLAQLAASPNSPGATGRQGLSDNDRLRLYLNINDVHANEQHPGIAAAFDSYKDAILPVLVNGIFRREDLTAKAVMTSLFVSLLRLSVKKLQITKDEQSTDCLEGSNEVKNVAMEILGHLAGMAESLCPFQPHQASSLFSTVARVLHDGSRGRVAKILALFAVACQTMGPSLMEAQAPLLAPPVAEAMRHESTVVRKVAAEAMNSLIGDAPTSMANCAIGPNDTPEAAEFPWAPCLLVLCVDDSIGVRDEALKAARRAVRLLKGNASIASWVLRKLNDGSMYKSMDRVLHHHEELPPAAAIAGPRSMSAEMLIDPPLAAASPMVTTSTPTHRAVPAVGIAGVDGASSSSGPIVKKGPSGARVKHAVMAWAIYLSLADADTLIDSRRSNDNTFDKATAWLMQVSGRFNDPRPVVRMTAVDAWEMFVSHCLSNVSPQQAEKVSGVALRPFAKRFVDEKNPGVREALLSALVRCVGSFRSESIQYLWAAPKERNQQNEAGEGKHRKGNGRLAELLARMSTGRSSGEDSRHSAAFVLASLLPCFPQPSPAQKGSLQHSGLELGAEAPTLLSLLQTLMLCLPAPRSQAAASVVGARVSNSGGRNGSARSCKAKPLNAMTTAGLIIRAWCGLAVWALSDARLARARAATIDNPDVAGARANDAPPASGATSCDAGGGGEKLGNDIHGCRHHSFPSLEVQLESDEMSTLHAIVGCLVSGWMPDGLVLEPGVRAATARARSRATETNKHTVVETVAEAHWRKQRMHEWRVALLSALVRTLSLANPSGERELGTDKGRAFERRDKHGGNEDWAQTPLPVILPSVAHVLVREGGPLDLPVELVHLSETAAASPNSAGDNPCCPHCTGMEELSAVIAGDGSGGSNRRRSGNASKDGYGDERKTRGEKGGYLPLTLQTWLWLLAGALRYPCECETTPYVSARATDALVEGGRESNEDVAQLGRVSRAPRDKYGRGKLHDKSFSEDERVEILCEILDISPGGKPARVLLGLSRGASAHLRKNASNNGHQRTAVEYTVRDGRGTQQEQFRAARQNHNTCLLSFARAWRAEAMRNLSSWGDLRRRSPVRVDKNGASLNNVTVAGEGACEGSPPCEWPAGGSNGRLKLYPSAALLSETGDALVAPLTLALLLSRSQPPISDCGSFPASGENVAEHTDVLGEAAGFVSNQHKDMLTAAPPGCKGLPGASQHEGMLWGPVNILSMIFGHEAASLWRKLLVARQAHLPGFAKVLKRLSKACATLALSVPSGSLPATSRQPKSGEVGSPNELEGLVEGGWGLVFSQTQPTQKHGKDGIRADTDKKNTDKKNTDAEPQKTSGTPTSVRNEVWPDEDGSFGPAPPVASLPLLTAATLALLRASPIENGTFRMCSWGAGLATLAWLLASPLHTQPLALSPATVRVAVDDPFTDSPTDSAVHRSSALVADTRAAELGACLEVVQQTVPSEVGRGKRLGSGIGAEGAAGRLPLDKDSLAPLSRLLALGITRGTSAAKLAPPYTACMFSHVALRKKVQALATGLLIGVKGLSKEALASSDILCALSPLFVAILDMPRSREANRLQSSLLDTWNSTFGTLIFPRHSDWITGFPPTLLRNLSIISGRAEVKMPSGLTLDDSITGSTAGGGVGDQGLDAEEVAEREDEEFDSQLVLDTADSPLLAKASARRGFTFITRDTVPDDPLRRDKSSPSNANKRKVKRLLPPSVSAGRAGGSKFVRVLGNGRGSVSKRPPAMKVKRAAVITHTLDCSQTGWGEESQLPDTELDSEEQGVVDECVRAGEAPPIPDQIAAHHPANLPSATPNRGADHY